MTPERQREFVRELAENVVQNILQGAKHWPADWDGHELRLLMADAFADAATMSDGRRKRAYRNVVRITPRLW